MGCFYFVVFVKNYVLNVHKINKKCKKMQKNAKNREKICIYKKFVVILHRQIKNETRTPNLETQKLKRKNE